METLEDPPNLRSGMKTYVPTQVQEDESSTPQDSF